MIKKKRDSSISRTENDELEIRASGRAVFLGFDSLEHCKSYVEKQKISIEELHTYIQKEYKFILELEKEVANSCTNLRFLNHMLEIFKVKE